MPLKAPVPLPFCTLLSAVVGPVLVFHTMPRSVTLAPPSAVTFPPKVALVEVTLLCVAVVTVGAEATGAETACVAANHSGRGGAPVGALSKSV